MENPLEQCEICKDLLTVSSDMELDVRVCQLCDRVGCLKCVAYRSDFQKLLCNRCYAQKQGLNRFIASDKNEKT